MGRTVLLAVIGLLALSGTLAEDKKVKSSVTQEEEADHDSSVNQDQDVTDHEFAESAPRSKLYKHVEPLVYASSAPHTSYSYRVFPQKASSVIVPKALKFNLRDSYGKYVESPQTAAYKPSYPQQFVRLQDLPPHLAQPLVSAASPSFQFRAIPNYFFGPQSHHQVPQLQLSGSSSGNQLGRFSEPLVYAEDIRNLAPQTIVHLPAVLQQSINSLQETKTLPKYQRLQEKPKKSVYKSNKKNILYRPQDVKHHSSRELAQQLQEAVPTKVPAVVNGKQTLVKVDTKPVLPLLDINLLEPLKFDNPLVPQIQHFLPKIPQATYQTLPIYNPKKDENKYNDQKEYTITKVVSYETVPKKIHNKSPESGIKVKGVPNSGDYSYEINTPNHKETYNEKVLKYNKETNSQPVEFSYNEQSQKKPKVYAFVHSSKEPLKVTHVEYNSGGNDFPMNNQEQEVDTDDSSRPSSQESLVDSEENFDYPEEDGAAQSYSDESPQNQHTDYDSQHFETPNHSQNYEQNGHQEPPKQQETAYLLPTQEYQAKGGQHSQMENYNPQQPYYSQLQASPPPKLQTNNSPNVYQNLNYEINYGDSQAPNQQGSFHGAPIASHQLKVEHRGQQQQYQQKPLFRITKEEIQTTPQTFAQPIIVQSTFQPIGPQNMRVLPTQLPHAARIKVDPNQHIQHRPQPFVINPSPTPQKSAPQQLNPPHFKSSLHSTSGPSVYGQAKRVFIKQNEETPYRKHKHTEQTMAEMIDQMENSEEDFEKAYEQAAFGFPAYKQIEEDVEKDIYNPESYGVHPADFVVDDPIFEGYQKEGDKFPKSARLTYKTIKDNNEEDYYSDFAIHKPESFADRLNSKVAYFKMYKNHKPKIDKGKNEKLIFAPTSNHFKTSSSRLKTKQNQPSFSAEYKPTVKYEYQYEYEPPKDSSAYASRPYHKFRTQFVEPQFQYGFEPLISAPIVAESEMAAVASNRSPESEKPGTRKKLYKEKWYIKKTTTRGKPS